MPLPSTILDDMPLYTINPASPVHTRAGYLSYDQSTYQLFFQATDWAPDSSTRNGLNPTAAPVPLSSGAIQGKAVPALPATTPGYLYYDPASGGAWSFHAATTAYSPARNEAPSGLTDGTNTTFTLAHTPLYGVSVYYAPSGAVGASLTTNLYQRLDPSMFTVSGTTLTFNKVPAAGSSILVDYEY